MKESFDLRQFYELWKEYIKEFGGRFDKIQEDLENNNFENYEIEDLINLENNGMSTIDRAIWTHFCAYRINAIKKIDLNAENAFDQMCDIIDDKFKMKFQRTSMPTYTGADERDEILLQIFDYLNKLP